MPKSAIKSQEEVQMSEASLVSLDSVVFIDAKRAPLLALVESGP